MAPLGECAKFIDYRGKTPPKTELGIVGVPLITAKNVKLGFIQAEPREFVEPSAYDTWMTRGLPIRGDVLFTTEAPLGNVAQLDSDERLMIGQRLITLRADLTALTPSFLKYALLSPEVRKEIFARATGATVQGIKASLLKQVPIPLPPLDEQKRIVAVLDEAFEGLARARANTEAIIGEARKLFAEVHRLAFVPDSEGERRVRLEDVAEITSRLVDPKRDEYADLYHLGAGNMQSGTDTLVDVKTAREEGLKSGKYVFDRSMVLYSKIRPYLRKVSRPDFDGLCSADVYPLVPKAGKLNRNYLFYLLLGPDFTNYAIAGSARAGMPKVNRNHLFAYQFDLPDLGTQTRVADALDAMMQNSMELAASYDRKIADLDALQKSLLQKAFSGGLT